MKEKEDMDKFLYTISHDLHEPLRSVRAFGTFLAEEYGDKLGDRGNAYLQKMLSAAERMSNMIDGLLELSRIGRDVSRHEVDLNEITMEVCAEMDDFIKERNGSVKSALLPIVEANRGEMKVLFMNLIKNAIKFNVSKTPSVKIKFRKDEDDYTLIFEDNAIPISPKDYERIFNVFERLHNREEYPGSGVGLAICKKIVECHGGKIWIEEGKKGNIFCFTLPHR